MRSTIVFRAASLRDAQDFDAFEIDEETGRERFVGYVSVPLPLSDARAAVRLVTPVDGRSMTTSVVFEGTSWSDAVSQLYAMLMLNMGQIEGDEWPHFEPFEARTIERVGLWPEGLQRMLKENL